MVGKIQEWNTQQKWGVRLGEGCDFGEQDCCTAVKRGSRILQGGVEELWLLNRGIGSERAVGLRGFGAGM